MDLLGIYIIKILVDPLLNNDVRNLVFKMVLMTFIILTYNIIDIIYTNNYMVIAVSKIKLELYKKIYDYHIKSISYKQANYKYYEQYFYALKNGVDAKINYTLILFGLIRGIIVFVLLTTILTIKNLWLCIYIVINNIISYFFMKNASQERVNLSLSAIKSMKMMDYINRILYHKEYSDDIKEIDKSFIFEKMERENNKVIKLTKFFSKKISINLIKSSFLKTISDKIVFLFLGIDVLKNKLLFSDFTALYYGITSMGSNFSGVVNSGVKLKEFSTVIEKANEFFEDEIYSTEKAELLCNNNLPIIEMEAVSIGIDENIILENIDFKILKEDKITLIKGDNGSGKSLLIKTLSGVNPAYTGALRYMGKDYHVLGFENLRREFSVMLQDFKIYQFSILDNIICNSDKPIDYERLEIALEKSGAKKIINSHNIGLDRVMSNEFNKSESFSMGELQKIAFTRAIYKKCNVLFLDETTSFYDAESKKKFKETLLNLSNNLHIVMVTHENMYDDIADLIINVKKGEGIYTERNLK